MNLLAAEAVANSFKLRCLHLRKPVEPAMSQLRLNLCEVVPVKRYIRLTTHAHHTIRRRIPPSRTLHEHPQSIAHAEGSEVLPLLIKHGHTQNLVFRENLDRTSRIFKTFATQDTIDLGDVGININLH